jgi:hypothetical protein
LGVGGGELGVERSERQREDSELEFSLHNLFLVVLFSFGCFVQFNLRASFLPWIWKMSPVRVAHRGVHLAHTPRYQPQRTQRAQINNFLRALHSLRFNKKAAALADSGGKN